MLNGVRNILHRGSHVGAALLVAVAWFLLTLTLLPHSASAAGLLTARSIKMSSSANGFVDAIYEVNFTVATTGNLGGIVVEFCSNTPIIGDSCTAPTGFTLDDANLVLADFVNIDTFTVDVTNSDANTLIITDGTPTSESSGTAASFELGNGGANGVTNPTNSNTTFYARILTYATGAAAQAYTSTSVGSNVDDGGVALSTANQITITARVHETLVFCIYTSGSSCSGASGNSITLGDANGVLSNLTTMYTSTSSKFGLSSNAVSGVTVRMKGTTLTSGANTISPHGASCTADSTSSSVEQFGLRLSSVGAGVSATAPYNCSAGNHGLDTATACSSGEGNITCTYGDVIATTAGATDESQTTMEFAAKAATTTEAGTYTATMTYIATGVY